MMMDRRSNCHVSTGNQRNNFYYFPNKKLIAPLAPRNTTTYIIRAKRSGGIAPPYAAEIDTAAEYSPAREEECGVDGYGSMNGFIRLRSVLGYDRLEGEGEIGGASSDSEIEHIDIERKLDHDVSRFEMIYPSSGDEKQISRFDDQNIRLSQLEEENFMLRERIFEVEKELVDLRRIVHCLGNNSGRSGGVDAYSASYSCVNGD